MRPGFTASAFHEPKVFTDETSFGDVALAVLVISNEYESIVSQLAGRRAFSAPQDGKLDASPALGLLLLVQAPRIRLAAYLFTVTHAVSEIADPPHSAPGGLWNMPFIVPTVRASD
jgi:hypothetical protein